MAIKKLLLIMMLFTYALSINHIMRHKTFPLFQTKQSMDNTDREFRTCFSGISPSSNYILLVENTVTLTDYINVDSMLLFMYDSKEKIPVGTIQYISERKLISMDLDGFQPSQTSWYCISFMYRFDKISVYNPFKNLKIVGASSDLENRIEYSLDINTANIVFYNISSDQGLKLDQLVVSKETIRRNDMFSATYEFSLVLENPNKRIWTKESVILKISSSSILFTDSVESTPASNYTENTPLLNLITFSKKLVTIPNSSSNYLILDKFDSNWHNGRSFKLTLNNLSFLDKVCSQDSSSYKIKFELLWRNTNSVISYLETNLDRTCTLYDIESFTVRHDSHSPTLYTKASWPLVFTLKASESITNQTIRLFFDDIASKGAVAFLNATCKITSPSSISNAFCYQNSGEEYEIRIKNVSLAKSSNIEIKMWVMIDYIDLEATPYKVNYLKNVKAEILYKDKTNVLLNVSDEKFTSTKTTESSPDVIAAFESNSDALDCTEQTNYDACYHRVENTSNFSLIKNESNSLPMPDFKSSANSNNKFELTVSSTKTEFADIKKLWATETEYTESKITGIKTGTHSFYFPPNFARKISSTDCNSISGNPNEKSVIMWKSTNYISGSFNTYNSYPSTITNDIKTNGVKSVLLDDKTGIKASFNISNRSTGLFNFLYFKITDNNSVISENDAEAVVKTTDKTEFSIQFSCIRNAYTDITYLHQAFDLVHVFTDTKIGRMNRFVTTVFQSPFYNINESNSTFNFINFHTISENTTNGICILVVDLAPLSEETTQKLSSAIINSLSFKFLDFENMNQYPILNSTSLRIGIGNYPSAFSNMGISGTFDHYNNFLFSYIEFTKATTTTGNGKYIIPMKCYNNAIEKTPNYSLIGSFKNGSIYNSFFKYMSTTSGINTITKTDNEINFNNLMSTEKWGLGLYATNELHMLANANPTSRYFALFSNYRINSLDTLDNNNTATSISSQTNLYALSFNNNKVKLGNGNIYQFGLIVFSDSTIGSSYIKTESNLPIIKIQGIDFPSVNLNTKPVTSDIYTSFYYTNGSTKYLTEQKDAGISFSDTVTTVTTLTSPISVKIFTSGLKKKGDNFTFGSYYVCASFEVQMRPSTNKATIDISTNYVSSYTICETNLDVELTQGPIVTVTSNTFISRITFYCCNLDVSSTNKLTVSSVALYSSGIKTHISTDGVSAAVVEPNESSSTYNSDVVTSLRYEPTTDNFSFGRMCLVVTLDHEIFRNMKVVISNTQMTSLEADSSIMVRCEAFVNAIAGDKNRLFETCFYNSSSGTITVTTRNVIEFYTNLDKKFDVCIWPIISKNITEKFVTNVYFDNDIDTLVFPNDSTAASTPKLSNTNVICNLTGSIVNIRPIVSGFLSNTRITIDQSNDQVFNTCMENYTNNSINEISLFFPPNVYGVVEESSLACYVNDNVVPNCIYDNDWINIRVSVGFSEQINIDVYGFRVLQEDQLPQTSNSKILIKANNINNTSILTIAQGKASFNELITRSKYLEPKLEDTINLAVTKVSYSITDSTIPPNTNVDITIIAVLDDLNGAFGKTIERTSLKDCNVIIQLPRDLRFSQSSTMKVNDVILPDVVEEFSDNLIRDYEFETISIYGRTIEATIINDIPFNNKIMSFSFVLTNVVTSYSNQIFESTRSGIINIAVKRSDLFLTTITNLYTFNVEEKLTTEFDMMSNNRTINFTNRSGKFFFNFNSRFVPKPGSYRPLAMDLRPVGIIDNITSINTSVEVTINSNNFFFMPGVKYNFRFNFEKSNNLMIGMNCNTLPGEYWLSFNHSDVSLRLFEKIPPIRVVIPFNLSKETVRLFFLEGNEITSSSNIQVGIDSSYIFHVGAVNASVSPINVSFAISASTATSIAAPSQVRIEAGSTRRMPSIYTVKTTATSERVRQVYQVTLTGNDCYSVTPSVVNFTPSITLEPISSTLNISKIISFEQEVGTNLNILKRNELRFTFDTRVEVVPVGSHIFCTLVCENKTFPNEDSILNILENKTETRYEKYYNTPLAQNRSYSTIFRDLIRGMNYKLKCILRTSALNTSISRTAVAELTQIEGKTITPSPTKDIYCMNIEVKTYSEQILKETIAIITEEFSSTFETLGCPVVINNAKASVDGINELNINRFECSKTTEVSVSKRLLQSSSTSTNSTSTDTTTEEVIINPKFAVCFIQSPICPTDANVVEINKLITNLFTKPITTTTPRILQTSSSSSTTKVTTTKFREKLSKEIRDNYIGFERIDIDYEFTVTQNLIKYLDQSNFQINAARKVNVKMRITNEDTDSMQCSWGLNLIPMNSGFPPSIDSLKNCDATTNPLCGEIRVIPGQNYIEFKDLDYNKLSNGKEYFLWLTCRQDIPISRIYTNPFAIGKVQVSWTYAKGVCINGQGDCKVEEPPCDGTNLTQFPACCPSKKASSTNALICRSERINYGLMMLFLVLMMLFN